MINIFILNSRQCMELCLKTWNKKRKGIFICHAPPDSHASHEYLYIFKMINMLFFEIRIQIMKKTVIATKVFLLATALATIVNTR